jgi:hypothetical protein
MANMQSKIEIDTDVNLLAPLSPIFNAVTVDGDRYTIDRRGNARIFMVGVDDENDHRWADSTIACTQNVAINDFTLATASPKPDRRRRRHGGRRRAVRQPVGGRKVRRGFS